MFGGDGLPWWINAIQLRQLLNKSLVVIKFPKAIDSVECLRSLTSNDFENYPLSKLVLRLSSEIA